jgi:hypothetical protein
MRALSVALGSLLLVVACSSAPGPAGHAPETDASRGDETVAPRDAGGDAPTKKHSDAGRAGEAGTDAGDGGDDAGDAGTPCSVDGEPGECITVSACATMTDMISTAGYCPGPADIECCRRTPSVADNPPTPTGYELMAQADVTTAMTNWAVLILDDPTDYPLFSTTTRTFGTLMVLARVEWHPPDFNNSAVHRGVTLYQPI